MQATAGSSRTRWRPSSCNSSSYPKSRQSSRCSSALLCNGCFLAHLIHIWCTCDDQAHTNEGWHCSAAALSREQQVHQRQRICLPASHVQNFRRAVEEGREVLDRRAGREPATQHAAWDALDDSDERNQVLLAAVSCTAYRCGVSGLGASRCSRSASYARCYLHHWPVVLLCALHAAGVPAGRWQGWRGQQHTGPAADRAIPRSGGAVHSGCCTSVAACGCQGPAHGACRGEL